MSEQTEAAKLYMLGAAAQKLPGRIEEIKKRAEEMKEDFRAKFAAIEDDENKAVEITAFTIFMMDIEELFDEVKP